MKQGRSGVELSRVARGGAPQRAGGGKAEPVGMGRLPGTIAQMGNQKGDHVTERRMAAGAPILPWVSYPVVPQPVGPTSGMGEGPGANRVVLKTGFQGKIGGGKV